MLIDGLVILILGMLTVFVFLLIMVIVMFFSAKIIRAISRIFPEVEETESSNIQRAVENYEDVAISIALVKQFTNTN